jgi:hypothetical protein
MIGGINPWANMWTSPRSTIRTVVNINPKYGVLSLAWIYALQTYLFFASYWSFGLSFSFAAILVVGLVLSPLIGWVWIYFTGWVLYFTGAWLGGKAPMAHLRTAAAWSKIPSSISLLMWLILMIAGTDLVFINGVSGPSSLFIHFILFILGVWSLVLLILSVREVQGFSVPRTLLNIFLAWLIAWVVSFFLFLIFRYLYITV